MAARRIRSQDADSEKSEKKKPRKHRSGSIDDVIPEGTPVEAVPIEIGVEILRSLQMKPAEFWVQEDRYNTWKPPRRQA